MRTWTRAAFLPVGLCLVGLGLGLAPLQASAQVELSMSAWVPPSHMLVKDGMVPWMKEVERVTEGRVKVKLLDKRAALVDIGKHLGMFGAAGGAPVPIDGGTVTHIELVGPADD